MVTTIRGTTSKPVSSQRLARFFADRPDYEGFLYIGYPIIGTPDGAYAIRCVVDCAMQGRSLI